MSWSKTDHVIERWSGSSEPPDPEGIDAVITQIRALNRVYAQLAEVFIRLEAETGAEHRRTTGTAAG